MEADVLLPHVIACVTILQTLEHYANELQRHREIQIEGGEEGFERFVELWHEHQHGADIVRIELDVHLFAGVHAIYGVQFRGC